MSKQSKQLKRLSKGGWIRNGDMVYQTTGAMMEIDGVSVPSGVWTSTAAVIPPRNYYGELILGDGQIRRAAPVERPVLGDPTNFPPYVRDSETSKEAAEAAKPTAATYRERVYDCIRKGRPLTDEEITQLTGLNPSTVRPRRLELARAGRIFQAEGYGKTLAGRRAVRWTTVPPEEF